MATYPTANTIAQGTTGTLVNSANWNEFVDNMNAIVADLVAIRTEIETFAGTDHTAAQASDVATALGSIRHQLTHISGETSWLAAPAGSLKVHTHAVGQGGFIPWGSLGVSNVRKVELFPMYRGGVQTNSLRGASPSGQNSITISNEVSVVSYVGRNCYAGVSAQVSLQDAYIAIRFTLPKDFTAWATSNAIQIEYKTDTILGSDNAVDVYLYKSGNGTIVTNSATNVSTSWSNISIDDSALGSWVADDIMELYLRLESRNNNVARIGRVAFNYTS